MRGALNLRAVAYINSSYSYFFLYDSDDHANRCCSAQSKIIFSINSHLVKL